MKLTPEQARELLYSREDPDLGLTVEADEYVTSNRWSSHHALIVKDQDGRLWETTYSQGLTERQDEIPFEYDPEVEFHEVEKVPVTTYEYRKKQGG